MYEKTRNTGFRCSENELFIINRWASKNGLSMGYVFRRAVKDFINNYVVTNIMPPSEEKNPGCIVKKSVPSYMDVQ